MKNFKWILFLLVALLVSTVSVNAMEEPVQQHSLTIVIEGKPLNLQDPPIIKNDRTLLPLRTILNTLGVKNEQIVWNEKERSIAISQNDQSIFLKIDSANATVDNQVVALDCAAMIYNNRTYIPVRFIAQSMGMRVIWDEFTRTVLIQNEKKFNTMKALFGKVDEAFSKTTSYTISLNAEIVSTPTQVISMESIIDKTNKTQKVTYEFSKDSNVSESKLEMIQNDGKHYIMDYEKKLWVQSDDTSDQMVFEALSETGVLKLGDVASAACTLEKETENEITLSSSIPFNEMLVQMTKKGDVIFTISKPDYRIRSMTIKTDAISSSGDGLTGTFNIEKFDEKVTFDLPNEDNTYVEEKAPKDLISQQAINIKQAVLVYIAETGDTNLSQYLPEGLTVENLLLKLQTAATQDVNGNSRSYGPYLESHPTTEFFRPNSTEYKCWEITIDTKTSDVSVEPSIIDVLTVN